MPKVVINHNQFHDLPGPLELGQAAQQVVTVAAGAQAADVGDVRFTMVNCSVHAEGQPIFKMELLADGTLHITLQNAEIWPRKD